MKKIKNLKFFVLLMLVFVGVTLHAYQDGDYMAHNSGYWNSNKIWNIYQRGQWHRTVSHPNENTMGTIYIPYGKIIYISTTNHTGQTITINKKLVIDGVLLAGPHHSNIQYYGTINLYGNIEVNGLMGMEYDKGFIPKILLKCYGNEYVNEISGTGESYIYKMYLYETYSMKSYLNVGYLFMANNDISCSFQAPYSSINKLYINNKNTNFIVSSHLTIREKIFIGGGDNFDEAATLTVEAGAVLELESIWNNTDALIALSRNAKYAKLVVVGERTNKATITGGYDSYWELSYPEGDYLRDGHTVMISAKNAVFDKMTSSGLVIRDGVKIKDNSFSFCSFKNSSGEFPVLLKLEGEHRSLTLVRAIFENSRGINIFKSSSLGTVNAWYCAGSRTGEEYDYDPYNTVNWIGFRDDNKDNQKEELNKAKVILSNYPNPFNPTTTISYNLPKSGKISLAIYNLKGEKVKDLLKNQVQPEGIHKVTWDGKDTYNKDVSSGTYIYKLILDNKIYNGQMSLLK